MLVVYEEDGETIKFDDRKVRYSGHTAADGQYVIYIAPTHFGEMQSADIRAAQDDGYRQELHAAGEELYNDPWAYFAQHCSVMALPVTGNNYLHLIKRSEDVDLFPGR